MKWPLYCFKAAELAIFMISARVFTVLLFDPASPIFPLLANAAVRRVLMGIAMGATATFIIRSPIGKRSGAHFNPARNTGSAVFAHVWTAWWVYFTAPLMGVLAAAEVYVRTVGSDRILCAKLHPDPKYPCPFLCQYPFHRHERRT